MKNQITMIESEDALNDLIEKIGFNYNNKREILPIIGYIFCNFTFEEIVKKIEQHKEGWNGYVGNGCRIISRILFQI
jgi:hypothetical protein